MRLIDADALYQSFGASGNCNNCPLDAYKCQYYNEHTLMEFCERIDEAPTVDAVPLEDYKSMEQTVNKLTKAIADAEPAVRCKDCRYYAEGRQYCDYDIPSEPNGYCSWGERREDVEGHCSSEKGAKMQKTKDEVTDE